MHAPNPGRIPACIPIMMAGSNKHAQAACVTAKRDAVEAVVNAHISHYSMLIWTKSRWCVWDAAQQARNRKASNTACCPTLHADRRWQNQAISLYT